MSPSICARSSFFMVLLLNCVFSSSIAPAGSRSKRARAAMIPVFDRAPSRTMQWKISI
jgi:hypothetical protein